MASNSTSTPDTPPRHEYTSFSSLLRNSPKTSDTPGNTSSSPVKTKGSGENGHGNAGWHLAPVTEEPGRSGSGSGSRSRSGNRQNGAQGVQGGGSKEKKGKEHMGIWKMMALTVSMAGSQVSCPAWYE